MKRILKNYSSGRKELHCKKELIIFNDEYKLEGNKLANQPA